MINTISVMNYYLIFSILHVTLKKKTNKQTNETKKQETNKQTNKQKTIKNI